MKGVLLVNMGGANSQKELKKFLSLMFKDPYILPFSKPIRFLLSFLISNLRYKKSWRKYKLIGGSPVMHATDKTGIELQLKLGESFAVKTAFSYSTPLIKDIIRSFAFQGITEVIVIPLYPQYGYSTTSSIEKEVSDFLSENKSVKIYFHKEFYNREGFVNYWTGLIRDAINKNNFSKPYLLFCAHSIPKYLVEKGDTYPNAIEVGSEAIAKKMNCDYAVAYQSEMKKGKWIGPNVKDCLKTLASKGKEQIVIVPISFVCENLETLFDIDMDIIPFAKNELKIKMITRAEIPIADPVFIELLKDIVVTNI